MATVSKLFTPADVFQGPADIYLGVQAPASAVPPVQYTNTLQLDSKGQPPIGTKGEIATVALGAGGTGYAVGDTLTVVQGGAANGLIRVLTVADGVVATVAVLRGGSGYSVASTLATVGGIGTGCTITISTITAGVYLGLTESPATCTVTPKFNPIHADQYSAAVDAAFVSQAAEIDFTVKELVFANLQRFFAGLFSASFWDLVIGAVNPATELLQIGSSPSSDALVTTLMLVAPRRDAANKYIYALAYKAYIASAIPMPVQRGKETVLKLKWKLLLDTSRVAKDMAMQIVRMT
jgi:hypothetical protein